MCTVDDLKEMGIPLGPRKKIANFVKHKAVKLVRFISAPKRKHNLTLTSLFIFWKFLLIPLWLGQLLCSLPKGTIIDLMEAQKWESARTGFKFLLNFNSWFSWG